MNTAQVPLLVSTVLFLVALVLILSDALDRTIVALVGAAAMVVIGTYLGFYDQEAAIASIDFETLGLLFGMMLLVALLQPTGMFEFLASSAARLSRGRPILLMILLGAVTSVLSMFLDNVTTVVLIAPVTILITEILGRSPIPYLISEAVLANTAGVATLVGDPPNVIIASAAGFSFTDFLTHALPMVLVIWFVALGLLIVLFRRDLKGGARDREAIEGLRPVEALHDWPRARKVVVVLVLTLGLFLAQDALRLSSALIALSMAGLALVWIRPGVGEVLETIEWPVLVFFGGLFVMVGGLTHSGALGILADLVDRTVMGHPAVSGVALIWMTAVASALVDNIPITVAMSSVINELAANGVATSALWWALAFGAGFGGNGTIIGSTANIIVVGVSQKTRHPITSRLWSRTGLPVMVATCLVCSLLFALAYPLYA